MILFRRYIHDSFQSLHLRKCSKEAEQFKKKNKKGVIMIFFSKYTPRKRFEINKRLQRKKIPKV